jgi:hypothetical protein
MYIPLGIGDIDEKKYIGSDKSLEKAFVSKNIPKSMVQFTGGSGDISRR